MDITIYTKQLLTHDVSEFPTECWEEVWAAIRGKKRPTSVKEGLHIVSCGMLVVAYWLRKIANPSTPVIGARGVYQECSEIENAAQVHVEGLNAMGIKMPMSGFSDMIARRMVAMVLTYIISVAEDSDKVQEIFEAVTAWISEYLDGQ